MRLTLLSIGVLVCCSDNCSGQDAKGVIQPRETWTNVFADQDIALHFTVAASNINGRLAWTFADKSGRVYERGRGEATAPAGNKPVRIALRTPPLSPGVVQEAMLTVSLIADGSATVTATHQKKLWIFSADPFAGRQMWLAGLHLKLYDPAAKAKTVAHFKELKIPFEEIGRAAALEEVQDGVIIVGEGVALQEEPELMPAMVRAAARGVRVLCLAPTHGAFVVPGSDFDQSPSALTFARHGVIPKLDKRLDANSWPSVGNSVATSLVLKADDNKVSAEATAGDKGWPWMAVDFPTQKGRLVVCGFAIIAAWEAGPTPRFLLARILEQFE